MTDARIVSEQQAEVERLRQGFRDLGAEHGSAGTPPRYSLVEYREAYDTAREKRRRGGQ